MKTVIHETRYYFTSTSFYTGKLFSSQPISKHTLTSEASMPDVSLSCDQSLQMNDVVVGPQED